MDAGPMVVLMPVFNDWSSASTMIRDLADVARRIDEQFVIVMVDDGSTEEPALPSGVEPGIGRVELVRLVTNLGHAGALAVGLSYVARELMPRAVLVMDADGEDRPEDVERLVLAFRDAPNSVYVAHRAHRSERLAFRVFYRLYRSAFRLLTGHPISFGNFCLIPAPTLNRLVYRSDLWNHLAATLVGSRESLTRVPTRRGKRVDGESKMNLNTLIQHGMGAIAVHLDRVLVRIMMALGSLSLALLGGIAFIVVYRFATDLATPGWATTVIGAILVLLMQSAVFAVLVLFVHLKGGASTLMIPARCYGDFVTSIERVE